MMNKDPSDWMWFRALAMLDKAEHLRRGLSPQHEGQQRLPAWQPAVDVYETDATLFVVFALPGVPTESIRILIKSGILIVAGERQIISRLRRSAVHRMEIPQGKFERRLELPSGYCQLGEHKMINGCLILRLHKLNEENGYD